MADLFANMAASLDSPYEGGFDASALESDTVALPFVTRALYVGGLGDISVTMKDGSVVLFTAVPAGTLLKVRATHLRAATTATLVIGLY
jgi:hypothetical protein